MILFRTIFNCHQKFTFKLSLKTIVKKFMAKSIFKKIILISFLLLVGFVINAQLNPNPIKNNLHLRVGPELDITDFRWSIAGNLNGEEPNILSEVIFNPVNAAGYFANLEYKAYKRISIDANFGQTFTYKGNATDFDYDGDNRTDPSVALYLKSGKGSKHQFSGNAWYHIFENKNWQLKTGAGYFWSNERYYLTDDKDASLQTTYRAKWKGPKINLLGKWNSNFKLFLGTNIAWHYFNYNAEANWNNIETFQHPLSFIQFANGQGWDVAPQIGYQFNRKLNLIFEAYYNHWKTAKGIDRLFLTNGNKPETRLNGAIKKSKGLKLGLNINF